MAGAHRHFVEALNGKKAVRKIDSTTPKNFLEQLVAYRRKRWEATDPNANEAQKLLWILQPALRQFLETFKLIAKYPLCYIERADQTKQGWLYTRVSFQGHTEPGIPLDESYQADNQAAEPTYTVRRLYLCAADGQPLLNLHPILISYYYYLYFLEYNQENEKISYKPCGQREMYYPPDHIKSFFISVLEPPIEDDKEESIDSKLDDTTNQLEEEENKDRFEQMPLAILLTHFSTEGREALEFAMGESLRIGRFWLGLEFLLMGLSRQTGGIFFKLLREIGLHPGEMRGVWRGMAGVVESERENWRNRSVGEIGKEALPRLRQVDVAELKTMIRDGQQPDPVITLRMMMVLQDAVKLADGGQVGPAQLLGAIFRHSRSIVVQVFFSAAYEASWSPEQVLQRVDKLTGLSPEELANLAPQTPQPPPRRSDRTDASPRPLRGGSVLGELGRDLTQAAEEGRLHAAVGETARTAITQIGRILLQREANNPILVGDPGVGKTAVVEGFAWRLVDKQRPVVQQLAGRRVIELSANALTSGTKYRGDLEERLKNLLAEVKAAAGQTIVFIDEIHNILKGSSNESIAEALKPPLARGEFPCIGATTVAEYRQYIEKDAALARRFTPVWLEEPTIEEAIEIVRTVAVSHLAEHHNVGFAPAAIEAAVKLSARYLHDERLPGKAIKVLDEAASGLIVPGTLFGGMADDQTSMTGVVSVEAVLEVISARTNIPVTQLGKTDKQRLRELESRLKVRVINQDQAIAQVVRVVKRSGAGLSDPRRPLGVFLFAGPTGVGKTELALTLTEALFDQEDAVFRLDMSEFMEKHQVARLIGAPPGYMLTLPHK